MQAVQAALAVQSEDTTYLNELREARRQALAVLRSLLQPESSANLSLLRESRLAAAQILAIPVPKHHPAPTSPPAAPPARTPAPHDIETLSKRILTNAEIERLPTDTLIAIANAKMRRHELHAAPPAQSRTPAAALRAVAGAPPAPP